MLDNFLTTLFNVLMVLIYAIPGFILIKTKMAKADHLKTLSTILVYVFSPCMVLYAFQGVERSKELSIKMILFLIVTLIVQMIIVGLAYFVIKLKDKNKLDDEQYKPNNLPMIGVALGNVGFFGLPIIKAVLPGHPEAMIYSTVFVISMNFIAFTIGAYAISGNKKYISIKPIFLNPTTITAVVALILFLFNFKFEKSFGDFGPVLNDGITLMGKMTTPVSMIILGMRLATADLKYLFGHISVYIVALVKLVVFPLLSYLLVRFLPGAYFDTAFKSSILILCACPCASIILNIAEMIGGEQKYAADMVLLSTMMSLITMPLVLLVL